MAPYLITSRFIIRPFTPEDLTLFAAYRADKNVARYQSWSDYCYKDAKKLFENMDYDTFGEIEDCWYQLAIADKHTSLLLGDLAVHFIDETQMEVGFTIASENQRKGVAFEALTRLLDYLFLELNKHRVIAFVDSRNQASYKLLEKAGFRREGHFRENVLFKGAWGDEYYYAKLQSEHLHQ